MTITAATPGLQSAEYELIESALAQTTRGRLFLAEYARRARAAETRRFLAAIATAAASGDAPSPEPSDAAAIAARLADLSRLLRVSEGADALCGKIDALAGELLSAPMAGTPESQGIAPAAAPDAPRQDALSWLDDLSLADRVAIFA